MAVCKIVNRKTGEFATKGMAAVKIWNKRGGAWASLSDLKKHVKFAATDLTKLRFTEYILYGDVIEYTDEGPRQTKISDYLALDIQEELRSHSLDEFKRDRLTMLKKFINSKVGK